MDTRARAVDRDGVAAIQRLHWNSKAGSNPRRLAT
jgi:hypothetical protein